LPTGTSPAALSGKISTLRGSAPLNLELGTLGHSADGAKIYKLTNIVGIQQISTEIPGGFKLSQNYPNPFNPSTIIKFDIPSNDKVVKLSIFNSLGQEVAVLVNKKLGAGSYEYTFDGEDLNSGVYFYKLQTESFSETKKMLFIK
jgi:hypothetical protein